MIITDTEPRREYSVGATPQAAFSIPFTFYDAADIRVWVDGGELSSGFAVTGTTDPAGGYSSGTVTLTTPVSSTTVVVAREVARTRKAEFPASAAFSIPALNRELGRLVQMAQDVAARIGRALRAPDLEPAMDPVPAHADRAGKVLGFDADGQPAVGAKLVQLDAAVVAAYTAGKVVQPFGPFTGDGSISTFDTGYDDLSLPGQVHVTVGGVPQFGSFTVSGSNIIFGEAPPAGAVVEGVVYGAAVDATSALATAAKNAAETAEDGAEAAQAAAAASQSAAASSASSASSSATTAATQATAAASSATAAQTARTGAETAQAAAETARTQAQTAKAAAESARDAAQTSQTAAATSATSASTSASSAATSATAAASSATSAATSATNAASSATAAAGSASAASTSATNAASSASAASTSASGASTSATAAAGSANAAATSATNAASSASSAAAAATAAVAADRRAVALEIIRGHVRSLLGSAAALPVYGLDWQIQAESAAVTATRASTGTYFDARGVMQSAAVDMVRYDHHPATGAPLGRSVEPQRTNLLTYSEQFDNAAWSKSGITVTANAAAAPDGASTMDKIVEDGSTGTHHAEQVVTKAASAVQYTFSAFLRAGERSLCRLLAGDGAGNGVYCEVDLSAGTISSEASFGGGFTVGSQGITAMGGGLYFAWLSFTSNTSTAISPRVALRNGSGTVSYAGAAGSGLYVWGAQLEAGAFATSAVSTTSAAATRSADVVSVAVSNGSYDVLVQDAAGAEWRDAEAVSGGSYTVTPRSGQRHISRLLMFPAGRLTAGQKTTMQVAL